MQGISIAWQPISSALRNTGSMMVCNTTPGALAISSSARSNCGGERTRA